MSILAGINRQQLERRLVAALLFNRSAKRTSLNKVRAIQFSSPLLGLLARYAVGEIAMYGDVDAATVARRLQKLRPFEARGLPTWLRVLEHEAGELCEADLHDALRWLAPRTSRRGIPTREATA